MYQPSTYPGFRAATAALFAAIGLLLAAPAHAQLPVEAADLGDRVNAAGQTLSGSASQAGAGGHLGGGGDAADAVPPQEAPLAHGSVSAGEPATVPNAPLGQAQAGDEPAATRDRVVSEGKRAKSDVEGALKAAMAALERVQAAVDAVVREALAFRVPTPAEWDSARALAGPRHSSGAPDAAAGSTSAHTARTTSPVASRARAQSAHAPVTRVTPRRPASAAAPSAPAGGAHASPTVDQGGAGGSAAASTASGAAVAMLLGIVLFSLAGLRTSFPLKAALPLPLGATSLLERPG